MTAVRHDRIFGRRREPHTVIIARGDRVRHFRVSKAALAALSGLGGIIVLGCIVLPGWYVLQDDVAISMAERQSAMRQDYEARIASLRAQLDNATSRQVLSRRLVETKVDALIEKQEALNARYDKIRPLLDRAEASGLFPSPVPVPQPKPDEAASAGETAPAGLEATTDGVGSSDSVGEPADLMDGLRTKSQIPVGRLRPSSPPPPERRSKSAGLSNRTIQEIGQAIDRVQFRQIAHMQQLAEAARNKTQRIASALRQAGIALPEDRAQQQEAVGGPYEPVPAGFETSYADLDEALDKLQRVRSVAAALPLSPPMPRVDESSPFGVRPDPFLGRPALHTGIDFAETMGTPVRATAAGKVVSAGPAGGYGNMVEIDHGNGITTRYGHMSRIDVSVGDAIGKGQQIGEVGSTGRSTGPHLHYEIRRNGEAVNPDSFFRIGDRIGAVG